jgi:diaminohydroxyphosphoribosylaminopyrimidine deaminase / 5-amino-6-(5-phosphoribosylamino)uracil reductase
LLRRYGMAVTNCPAVKTIREQDEHFMRVALNEAQKAFGQTSPNPAVGAVLVMGNRVVAKGHHSEAGREHAEIECLRNFGGKIPEHARLYVTLEPCSTVGRTGPCTNAIIKAGVKEVVVGAMDVNPRHHGRGIAQLRAEGINVREGILAEQCARLNEAFNKWIVSGQPFVIAKCGMSLDGHLTRKPGEPRWLTDVAARRDAHQLRASVDAILVGARTVRADNPRLTARGERARQPWRVVLSRSGHLPSRAHLFSDQFAKRTLVYNRESLATVLKDLGKKNITSVLIEGGGDVLGQALDARLIDKIQLYLAPILTGGPVTAFGGVGAGDAIKAMRLTQISYRRIGQNVCVTGWPSCARPNKTGNLLSG